MSREAMEMALEWIKSQQDVSLFNSAKTIKLLEEALAQPEIDKDGFMLIQAMWGIDFVEMKIPDGSGEVARFYHDSNWRMKGKHNDPKPDEMERIMLEVWQDVGDPRFPHIAQPEPVAWAKDFKSSQPRVVTQLKYRMGCEANEQWLPLYTAPPQSEWIGLTENELSQIHNSANWNHDIDWSYERAIEAKLKEKNT